MRLLIAAVLILFVGGGQAFHWPRWGRCPSLQVEQQFDIVNYMGYWYQQYGYNTVVDEAHGRCSSAYYNYSDGVIDVYNRQITSHNKTQSVNGTAVLVDPSKDEAKLAVNLHIKWFLWWFKVSGPYWVLGTDYVDYSVVYSCENFLLVYHYCSVWLMSRQQYLDDQKAADYKQKVVNDLKSTNLDISMFTKIDQQHCNI